MNQITFLHCAGLNLGYGFMASGYSDAKKLTIRKDDLNKAFSKILEIASYEKANFVLICGNFLDTENIDESTIHFINTTFAKHRETQVIILVEEDSKVITKGYKAISENENVTLLTSYNNSILLKDKSTYIYGVNKDSGVSITELVNDSGLAGNEDFKVIASSIPFNELKYQYGHLEPTKMLAEKGLSYVACGYTKNRTSDDSGYQLIYNCGTPEPKGPEETGAHGIYSVTLTKKDDRTLKKGIAFIDTAARTYQNVEADISECFTEDAIKEVILNKVKPNLRDIYNVTLTGKVIPDLDYSDNRLAEMLSDDFFDLKISSEKVEYYDIEAIASEPGIKGIFARKLIDEINSASNEKQRSILKKALFFGIHALDGMKIQI